MHAIRRRARHASWRNDSGDLLYNPFARARSRESNLNTNLGNEISLGPTQSEGRFEAPRHAATIATTGSQAQEAVPQILRRASTVPTNYPVSDIVIIPNDNITAEPAMTDKINVANEPRIANALHKRSKFKSIFQRPATDLESELHPLDRILRGQEDKSKYLGRHIENRLLWWTLTRQIPLGNQFRATLFGTWLNLLLPFIPAGFVVNYAHRGPATVFSVNFVAIIPSAALMGFAIEELAIRLGDIYGGLLSITFSNAVQLITSILLLKKQQIFVLQTSLLGYILSNLLFMTGLGFFLGGLGRLEQYFDPAIAQTIGMLLLLAVLSVVVPTTAHLMTDTTPDGILGQSRGTSVVILVSYGLYILFQYITNRDLYKTEQPKVRKAKPRPKSEVPKGSTLRGIAGIGATTAAASGGGLNASMLVKDAADEEDEGDDFPEPNLSLSVGIILLTISVVLLAFNTQFATDNLQGLLEHSGLTQSFVGLVIIPILSNDPQSIKMAMLDKMDLSIALTLERCMKTALMVVPCVVLVAWGMRIDEMTLEFDGFTTAALFASIIIVTYVVQEGKSNWLTGALLIKVYIIIAISAFYRK